MIIKEEDYLAHYGILRRSGRYPWGSGGDTSQRSRSFMDYVSEMKKSGMSEADIAKGVGMSTTELRAARTIAKAELKQADVAMAQRLKDKGLSNTAIGERMDIPESTVRTLLKPGADDRANNLQVISSMLKEQVDSKGFIDVGAGVENQLGISKEKLAVAMAMLKEDGYQVHGYEMTQVGTGLPTKFKVLGPPDSTQKEAWEARESLQQIQKWSEDGGRSLLGITEPLSIDSKRLAVRYAEEGGADADGVIYIRPGVKDVSLGGSNYAQVRVAIDGSHYLKGMAIYKDDLPDGVDLMFNTNKSNTGNKLDALKKMSDDPDNPFGAALKRQIVERDADGKERATSAMNIVNEAGDWDNWSRNLSSQMLSKQTPNLAKTQLDLTYANKMAEFDDIMKLTNPVVKKKMLESFADDVDASAVHLKAASMPRQSTHVILPINSLKETEIYAPNFRHGERVALVRYPHGGTFEIPELVVNNSHAKAKKALGAAKDAVGINAKVAERLSGADFDGDTVLVIPNNSGRIRTTPALEGLKNFDPRRQYKLPEGQKFTGNTQQLMGDVSNLITDMTIKGANTSEIARAVKHSMVVIDAEKHGLNHKLSAQMNGIKALKEKYQTDPSNPRASGASTLISRAKSEQRVPERVKRRARDGGPINPLTGELMYTPTGKTYVDKSGKTVPRTTASTKLGEAKDAHTLSSGTTMEKVYADHSNRLKAMANQARKEYTQTKDISYSPSAKKVYSEQVSRLDHKLNVALQNAPRERQAQVLANATISAKRQANPSMDKPELKKIKSQALAEARARTGAAKSRVDIQPDEWEAIQAGAISTNKLKQIIANADLDKVKELAMPRQNPVMTDVKQQRAAAMLASGYTQAEVADAIGVPLSTLKSSIE